MFKVMDLAWFILRRCSNNGTPISNLHLQKILFFLQRDSLQNSGSPLFSESIEAWQYGPVIPELYFRLKTKTLGIASDYRKDWERFENDTEVKNLLEAVYRKYGKYTGGQLSNLTHNQDTPWDITVRSFKSLIEEDLIKTHYKDLLRKAATNR